ncbi:hypothetical protein [Falsibacillus pallidus]|uniref:Uncharacterized protein n=1 Tax=Falsibacillus pallidus TaxID=493781 RepID=A0A370G3Q9_9BACI|nr:hypothetical protein [Falsibacillus pallidus]RDI38385.1 hypothetical protein DFR59_1185 [Falsibacillus pallidus]
MNQSSLLLTPSERLVMGKGKETTLSICQAVRLEYSARAKDRKNPHLAADLNLKMIQIVP